jgi:lipopolysaccharide biosynthesis glycosyltransferase
VPTRQDGFGTQRARSPRQLIGKVLRRGARRLDAAQAKLLDGPPLIQAAPPRRRAAAPARQGPRVAQPRRPVDGGPAVLEARQAFFRSLEQEGDFALAATTTVRAYARATATRRARTFGQVLQLQGGDIGRVGELCMAMIAARSRAFDTAWAMFTALDLADVLRLAPAEYFRAGFAIAPETAAATLARVARGQLAAHADAADWYDIACTSFALRAEHPSRYALDRAEAQLGAAPDERAEQELRRSIEWLASWYGRAGAQPPLAAGATPVAVLGHRQPDRAGTSRNLGDHVETVACLAHLARRTGVRFTGEPDLVTLAGELRDRVPSERTVAGADTTVQLCSVDRDASEYACVPDGTWLIWSGRLPHPMFGIRTDMPLDPRLRPVFVSVHVDSAAQLSPAALDYLRRYAPIGCRDWATVGVPAFFSGALSATVDLVAAATSERTGRLFVDAEATEQGTSEKQEFEEVHRRDLAENLRDAVHRVDGIRARRRVVTTRLQTYLAARAVGTRVDMRPANASERRFDGLLGIDDGAFSAMRRGITDRLAAVWDAIESGAGEDEVYATWRRICAADVAEAEAQRAAVAPLPASSFDVAAACAAIRAASVAVERSAPAPDGEEINVELSLDGNYKHQLEVVLDSIVEHASRPVRAFVMCRDLTRADYDRVAALFPSVSFLWLPTDSVDYGPISGLLGYTTVATMDRLLLADLLPEVARIIHHDLDALCLSDIAELFDVELDGRPIAGRSSSQENLASGFAALMRQSQRFPQRPERGRDYLRRTHARHGFDYQILNAGIMVLDLERMRADGFCAQFLPYVEFFGLNDQAVLNVYAGRNRVEVAPGWNWRPWLEAPDDPKIAHWAGEYKPWADAWVFGRHLWRAAEARVAARYERAGLG